MLRGVGWVGTNPGGPGGCCMPGSPKLKASAHPLPPRPAGCAPPHTLIYGHRARTGPRCTRTHILKHTHEHARARTRLPLRSASYLPCRRGSSWTPGCRHSAGTGSEAGRARGSRLRFRPRIRWGWPGADAPEGTPRLRPAPPRCLHPFGDRGVVFNGAGGPGPLRMRTGPALWG